MPDGALRILSIGLLALLYLFFLRALRAVWVETRAAERRSAQTPPTTDRRASSPTPPPRNPRPPSPSPALVVLEPAEQRGRRHELGDEITIGRAPGCHIRLEDDYVSQLHARLFRSGQQLMVEDLGSTNGTFAGTERVSAPRLVHGGEVLRVGSFAFEVEA